MILDKLSESGFSPLWLIPFATLAYVILTPVYNLFLHPLRAFPGPILYRAYRLPYCVRALQGTLPFDVLDFHERYGPIVRIAPNQLAFATPSAWKDIMGHRPGAQEVGKWQPFYRPADGLPSDIVSADRDEHSRLRRQLAHGFSDKSIRDQEPIIKQYVDVLFARLKEMCAAASPARTGGGEGKGEKVDVAAWYNFTTFDIIGDLAFGDPFGCLKNGEYHPWVKNIFWTAKVGTIMQSVAHYGLLKNLLLRMIPSSLQELHAQHTKFGKEKLLKRMEAGMGRPDLIEGLLQKTAEWDLDLDRLTSNASILVIGGSETTATILAGATYLLCMNPEKLAKLTAEVRSTFKSDSEIDIASASQLTYLKACMEEALRLYPPVPTGLPRVIPSGGRTVSDKYIPEGTHVAVFHWATYHTSFNFTDPFGYHPERHLGDPRFSSDNLDVMQPFHVGPRNCIGRNLAYAEMRLIMARMVYNFDMRIADESRGWIKQRVFNIWEKGPLMVHLTHVSGE